MMNLDDYDAHERHLMAKMLAKLHRGNHYGNNGVPIEAAASLGIPVEDRGIAKTLLKDMVNADDEPIRWLTPNVSVALTHDRHDVALFIARLDGSQAVPWDLIDHLE